ncbi:transaldolase family protein [Clostridium sp. WLY-B-L2]|uniref:Transaldolase family protein n=1 Tax=Clostridium aromativorans TaxID=2836848 RepID=A0ABS8N7G0_9CLOT|nr:transaldolase family protein [Clostridium aromativorans]MCC9295746.1 transaldolase family protein [Clostridium aromativorans]
MNQNIYKSSAMERLNLTSQDMELWWDSNPLIYETWCEKFLKSTPDNLRDIVKSQLKKLWDSNTDSEKWVFKGVTTNPPLTKAVFDLLGDKWAPIIRNIIHYNPKLNMDEITWRVYMEACKRGAARYLNLYEQSSHKYGFVSAQVNPQDYINPFKMVKDGLGLKQLQANIMVKVPATEEGVLTIFILTLLGIPTNATLSFTLPQIMAVAKAVKSGRELGEKFGTDYSNWRSVITLMIGRFEDAHTFEDEASERGVKLTEKMKRWAGIAIAKKACRILTENKYPSKLLICSMRVGPEIDGVKHIWHIEKLAGENMIFTMNPNLIQNLMLLYIDRPLKSGVEEQVPEEIIEELLKIPYFSRGYGEETIAPDEFKNIEPTFTTYKQFSSAVDDLESFVSIIKNSSKGASVI